MMDYECSQFLPRCSGSFPIASICTICYGLIGPSISKRDLSEAQARHVCRDFPASPSPEFPTSARMS